MLGAFEDVALHTGDPLAVVGYLDDNGEGTAHRFAGRGVRCLGGVNDIAGVDATHYLAAVGWPGTRRAIVEQVERACSLAAATVIHPDARSGAGVSIGEGTVVLGGVRISPLASVGRHAYVSHGVLLGHDCVVEDFVSVMPGAAVSGDTRLGTGCTIGTNAAVIEGVTIGAGATVGAGAVAVRDVPDGVTVVGVPAKELRRGS